MSQKILIAFCLLGAVAFVSAQNWQLSSCTQGLREAIESFRLSVRLAADRYFENLQQTGTQATDLSPIRDDIDKLVNSLEKLQGNNFNLRQAVSIYLDNMSTIASLASKSFRASLATGMIESYVKFGTDLFDANTKFIELVTRGCSPTQLQRVFPLTN